MSEFQEMRLLGLLFLLFVHSAAKNATIRVQLTERGLHFFSEIGHHILDYEVRRINFPLISIPITGGPGSGVVNVTDLRIQSFSSPDIKLKLIPPHGLGWISHGGAVTVKGHWSATYDFILPIHLSGYVRASALDIRTLLEANADVYSLRPQLNIDACSMDVDSIDVTIGGGVVPWIVNLFRPALSALVKEEIRSQLCATLETVLLDQANLALLSIPTHIPLKKDFYVNYRCEDRPVATKSFIEGEIYSDVVYGNVSCDLPTSEMDRHIDETGYMTHFWISQHIPNCLLSSAHSGNLLSFVVDKRFGKGKFEPFLRTTCSIISPCIGRFFPKLREEYPNESVQFLLHTAQPPTVLIEPEGAVAEFVLFADLFVTPPTKYKNRLARLAVNTSLDLVPVISNRTLSGHIENVTLTLTEIDSTIGDFSRSVIAILEVLMKETIELASLSLLGIGIRLPIVDNITLSDNATLITKQGFVMINSDFVYD